jgi:hypothetical protein
MKVCVPFPWLGRSWYFPGWDQNELNEYSYALKGILKKFDAARALVN